MKFPFIIDPNTGKPSEMVTLTVVVTLAATTRFLFDGMSFHIFEHVLTFTKLDPMVYISLLTPVFGAHGYLNGKKDNGTDNKE